MRRQGVYLILVVLVVGGVLVWVFGRREREPEYGGKRLSEWVERDDRIPSFPLSGLPPLEISATDEAIRGIGTNGIPFLLKWIGYHRPAWREKLYTKINEVVLHVNRSWRFNDARDIREGRRARRSINALLSLGPASENAVGDLTRMVEKPGAKASAARAAIVLNGLGKPITVAPFILNVGSERIEVHGPIINSQSQNIELWETTMSELSIMQAERTQTK